MTRYDAILLLLMAYTAFTVFMLVRRVRRYEREVSEEVQLANKRADHWREQHRLLREQLDVVPRRDERGRFVK